MSRTYKTAQGDRYTVARQLGSEQNPVDLDGRNVQFIARHSNGDKIVDAVAEVRNARQGHVIYQMTPTETALAGTYELEWIVTGGSDDPTTFPVDEPATLRVREDVEKSDLTVEELPPDRTVSTLFAEQLNGGVTGNQALTNIAGMNLSIVNGALEAATGDTMTDAEIQSAINADADHGSTAPHDYYDDAAARAALLAVANTWAEAQTFEKSISVGNAVSFADRSGDGVGFKISEDPTSGKLLIEEAGAFGDLLRIGDDGAIEVPSSLTVATNAVLTSASTSADWSDYEIQKDGTDGAGIINFKTV